MFSSLRSSLLGKGVTCLSASQFDSLLKEPQMFNQLTSPNQLFIYKFQLGSQDIKTLDLGRMMPTLKYIQSKEEQTGRVPEARSLISMQVISVSDSSDERWKKRVDTYTKHSDKFRYNVPLMGYYERQSDAGLTRTLYMPSLPFVEELHESENRAVDLIQNWYFFKNNRGLSTLNSVKSVEELLESGSSLLLSDLDCIIKLFSDLASSLSELHSQGLTHNSILPRNITMLHTENGYEYLVTVPSFGLDNMVDSMNDDHMSYFSPQVFSRFEEGVGEVFTTQNDVHMLGTLMMRILLGEEFDAKQIDADYWDAEIGDVKKSIIARLGKVVPASKVEILCDLASRCVLPSEDSRPSIGEISDILTPLVTVSYGASYGAKSKISALQVQADDSYEDDEDEEEYEEDLDFYSEKEEASYPNRSELEISISEIMPAMQSGHSESISRVTDISPVSSSPQLNKSSSTSYPPPPPVSDDLVVQPSRSLPPPGYGSPPPPTSSPARKDLVSEIKSGPRLKASLPSSETGRNSQFASSSSYAHSPKPNQIVVSPFSSPLPTKQSISQSEKFEQPTSISNDSGAGVGGGFKKKEIQVQVEEERLTKKKEMEKKSKKSKGSSEKPTALNETGSEPMREKEDNNTAQEQKIQAALQKRRMRKEQKSELVEELSMGKRDKSVLADDSYVTRGASFSALNADFHLDRAISPERLEEESPKKSAKSKSKSFSFGWKDLVSIFSFLQRLFGVRAKACEVEMDSDEIPTIETKNYIENQLLEQEVEAALKKKERYIVQKRLSDGASAIILQVKDNETQNIHVMKRFREGVESDYEREVKCLKLFSHKNIVQFVDNFSYTEMNDGKSVKSNIVIMEFCNFGDLFKISMSFTAGKPKPMRPLRMLKFTLQLFEAIAHIHEFGYVHSDIKPQNIFLAKDGTLKLGDFGFTVKEKDTVAGGTLHYLPPEQEEGQPAVLASDLYSAACSMFEVLAKKKVSLKNKQGVPTSFEEIWDQHNRNNMHFHRKKSNPHAIGLFEIFKNCLSTDYTTRRPAKEIAETVRGLLQNHCATMVQKRYRGYTVRNPKKK